MKCPSCGGEDLAMGYEKTTGKCWVCTFTSNTLHLTNHQKGAAK